MKQVRNKKRSLNIQNTHWAGLLVLIVVLGSMMSYGLIATLFKLFNRETAVSMLFIIIPMTILMFLSMNWILKKIQRKMNLLTDAIDQVAGGDLSVRIPLENAEEYRTVYEEFNRMVRELAKTKKEMQNFTNEFAHEFKMAIASSSRRAQIENNLHLSHIENEYRLLNSKLTLRTGHTIFCNASSSGASNTRHRC